MTPVDSTWTHNIVDMLQSNYFPILESCACSLPLHQLTSQNCEWPIKIIVLKKSNNKEMKINLLTFAYWWVSGFWVMTFTIPSFHFPFGISFKINMISFHTFIDICCRLWCQKIFLCVNALCLCVTMGWYAEVFKNRMSYTHFMDDDFYGSESFYFTGPSREVEWFFGVVRFWRLAYIFRKIIELWRGKLFKKPLYHRFYDIFPRNCPILVTFGHGLLKSRNFLKSPPEISLNNGHHARMNLQQLP